MVGLTLPTSEAVLDEPRRVLKDQFDIPPDKVQHVEHDLRLLVEIISVAPRIVVSLTVPDDDPIGSSMANEHQSSLILIRANLISPVPLFAT